MTVKEHWFIGDWLMGRLIDFFSLVGVGWFVGWQDGNKSAQKTYQLMFCPTEIPHVSLCA